MTELPIYRQILEENSEKKYLDLYLTENDLVTQTRQFMINYRDHYAHTDAAFFLDKGARPIAYLFRKLHPYFVENSPLPQIRHINIGRRRKDIPFSKNSEIIADTYGKHLVNANNILVVDDYINTRGTLTFASDIIAKAFPNSNVSSLVTYTKIPAWQGRTDYTGVEEPTMPDVLELAIQELNRRFDTSFADYGSYVRSSSEEINRVRYEFVPLVTELEGTIPFTKPHTQILRRVRTELDYLCNSVISSE